MAQCDIIYNNTFINKRNKSWNNRKLGDLITVKYGKDHKKLLDGKYPVLGSGGIMRYAEKSLYDKESVLIPRKGTLNNVIYINEPFWTVDTMFYTQMKKENIAKYIYHFIKKINLESMNSGSAVPSMTTEILNQIIITEPDIDTLKYFENIVSPMYLRCNYNKIENKQLVELRDTLLPKLMSGELDVSEIEL